MMAALVSDDRVVIFDRLTKVKINNHFLLNFSELLFWRLFSRFDLIGQ
jgi:hypothetical protein